MSITYEEVSANAVSKGLCSVKELEAKLNKESKTCHIFWNQIPACNMSGFCGACNPEDCRDCNYVPVSWIE